MKKVLLLPVALAALLIGIAGCQSPPTKFEQGLFDFKTNVVERVVTNVVNVPTPVPVPVYHTNEVGLTITNTVTQIQIVPQYVTITNRTEQITWTPKAATMEGAQAAGGIANIAVPGSGGLITGILSGLAIAWAKLRSYKTTGTVLAQNIETLREFLKTLPNGEKYDTVLTQYMQSHQAESGVLQQVIAILQQVNNDKAKLTAEELKNALAMLSKPN